MTNMKRRPVMLMILDGYGLGPDGPGNAVQTANTPTLDRIFSEYPFMKLNASGLAVGLPEGQMGNSEVGHLNIGAGRIIYQELTKITKSIEDGTFYKNIPLENAMNHGGALHIFGLLSDGGVHSHIDHIKALLKMAQSRNVKNVWLHCFLDGRDVPPTSGIAYMEEMENYIKDLGLGKIATVCGRYYAMDRDKRWERLEKAYDALTVLDGFKETTGSSAVKSAYDRGETDEFIKPTIVSGFPGILDGDEIIFANFRPDRAREITRAFTDQDFDGFKRKKIVQNLLYVCMTQYDATMPGVEVAFPPHRIKNTLGEYLSSLGLHQLRIAETEKYAHVTFFFNGGVEQANPLEDRILIPSPKVATYDLKPEMSAPEVTEKVLEEISSSKYDVIILNFANSDMVGHTGVFDAAVKAVETVDHCVNQIVSAVIDAGGMVLLTADHGNADDMLDEKGNIVTAHSTNPVPFSVISKDKIEFKDMDENNIGKLSDIAPTMLHLMGLKIPVEMTGSCLVSEKF